MGAGVIDGDGHRRRGGDVACGVAGSRGHRVGAVVGGGGVHTQCVGRGPVLSGERSAVHQELHPGHPDIVAGGGAQGHGALDCPRRRRGEAHRGHRDVGVGDGDGQRRCGGGVACGVASSRVQLIGAVGERGGVPRHAVGRFGDLGGERSVVHQELHPGHPDIVGGGGAQGHVARHPRVLGGSGEAHRGVRVIDGDGHRLEVVTLPAASRARAAACRCRW